MDSEGFCVFGDEIDDAQLTRSDRFAQRVVSLGPHNYINQAEGLHSSSNGRSSTGPGFGLDGPSLASLVEIEHEKISGERKEFGASEDRRLILPQVKQAEHSSEEDSSLNENHSCEDEELVISPQDSGLNQK